MSSFNAYESSGQSNIIVSLTVKLINIKDISLLTLIVRKTGHFVEYLILGIWSYKCFKSNNINKYLLISILFCIFYSITDEIHQLFVLGRSCELRDILIDSTASVIGCLIMDKFRGNSYEEQNW